MAFAPPNYAVTTDGLPLVTEWSSVLSTDWSRINPANPLAFFLQPLVPLAAVALYLLSEPVFDRLRLALDVQPKSPALVYSIALHNVILAVFSGWVAVYTWPLFTRALAQGGLQQAHCAADFWGGAEGFGFWATIFYVSKFYEFVDTWILVLKNSDGKHAPSFLQVYHHTGIAIAMWMAVVTASNWAIWVTVLNSSIHTLMYAYYTAVTLSSWRTPYAKYLTNMQMLQFVTGIVFASQSYWAAGCRAATPAALQTLALIQLYALGLLFLFNAMAKKKYAAKGKGKKVDDSSSAASGVTDSPARNTRARGKE